MESIPTYRKRPISVDLFAGAGGMSLGFEQAGFDVVASVEIDPVHAAIHKFNFPQSAIIAKSVSEVTGKSIREAAGIGNTTIDCVFGGAPCQGFSMIGKRLLDDPRNSLVKDFARIVDELDAQSFVFENVKGLTVGKHRKLLDEIIVEFTKLGYELRLPYQVLNAANYNVPQSRERLFLVGTKKGISPPKYPLPTTSFGKIQNSSLPNAPTAKQALADLPDPESVGKLDGDRLTSAKLGQPSKYASKLRNVNNTTEDYAYTRIGQQVGITGSATTAHTDISRRRFSETTPGKVETISRFFKLHPDGQSNTLRAGTDGSRGAFTSPRPIHYKFNRCVTIREMARLHGFPDWFRFHVTKWNGGRQIGNSVPPPLAKAVATELRKALKINVTRPVEPVSLGNIELLSLTLKSAAAYFEVSPPDRRRTMKSGSKKRSQKEIEAQMFHEAAE